MNNKPAFVEASARRSKNMPVKKKKVASKKKATAKKSTAKKTTAKKVAPKKTTRKKIAPKKTTATKKRVATMGELMSKMMGDDFWGSVSEPMEQSQFPKVNISEDKENIKVVADIPGVDPKNIDIKISDDFIEINGWMGEEEEEKKDKFYRYEREVGEFSRGFSLPAIVDYENAEAEIKNGVLHIIIPKLRAGGGKPKTRRVRVRKGK